MTVREILDAVQAKYRPPTNPAAKYFMVSCPNPAGHKNGDRNPSMRVDAEFGHFHCYACGFSGPLARLLMFYPGGGSLNIGDIEFARALQLPRESAGDREDEEFVPRAIQISGGLLPVEEVPEARQYLAGRGISDEFIDYFEIKAARMAFINGTRFWNRVCIPIFYQGQLVSVEGRDWTRQQEKKCIYPQGGMNRQLFHFESVDLSHPVILTEGVMDFASIFGITRNLIGSFGSEVTAFQGRQLATIPHLIVIPDNDAAGAKMLEKVDGYLPDDREFLVAAPPAHRHDPGDCTPEEIRAALDNAIPYGKWLLRNEHLFEPGREWPAELLSGGVL